MIYVHELVHVGIGQTRLDARSPVPWTQRGGRRHKHHSRAQTRPVWCGALFRGPQPPRADPRAQRLAGPAPPLPVMHKYYVVLAQWVLSHGEPPEPEERRRARGESYYN